MYITKSPMRFDLSGGTLDLWPIWAMLKRATTINVSISLYSQCEIKPRAGKKITIESLDYQKVWEFGDLSDLLSSKDKELHFYQAHISHWMPQEGFHLITSSESPVGGGLGGSSSLSISVYQTFLKWRGGAHPSAVHDVVRTCSNIEAHILKTPTGTQDYYGAISPGLNIIDFDFSGTKLQTLSTHKAALQDQLILVYTGKSHHSGINNWQVLKKFIEGDIVTAEALHDIQEISFQMKDACLSQDWDAIPQLFAREYEARLLLAESFVSPEILKLKSIADKNGARGFKICGAGGGGCVGLWTTREKKTTLVQVIQQSGFQVLDAQIL